jgi:hypothetical protein
MKEATSKRQAANLSYFVQSAVKMEEIYSFETAISHPRLQCSSKFRVFETQLRHIFCMRMIEPRNLYGYNGRNKTIAFVRNHLSFDSKLKLP